jgi:hypothetical protein
MRKFLPLTLLLACIAFFAYGIVELFELRFETGDVYPAYSSLRADPLGTMAFYESLGKMPGVSVRRDISAENRLPDEPGTAYLHLAAEYGEWGYLSSDTLKEIKDFVNGGGRLVITYFPTTSSFRYELDEDKTNSVTPEPAKSKDTNAPPAKINKADQKNKTDKTDKTDNKDNADKKKKKKIAAEHLWVSLEEEWGFHDGFQKLPADGDTYQPVTVTNKSDLDLPLTMKWHSALIFTNCDPKWTTVYARGTNAVVIERKFSHGSVVLASDSYFLSNEAMLSDRHADLLAWLVGNSRHVVFDEAHLGIVEQSGIAGLMRKYRLHGFALGLLLLAALFIWKNSASLVPPHPDERSDDFVTGKDAAAGFVNLLRRNVPSRNVFGVSFAEWKKSAATSGKVSRARLQQAEAIFEAEESLPQKDRNPIATYRTISETLRRKKPLS